MAECFLVQNGGSNPLNFRVVGNPQHTIAKENTIWVDTDKINKYYFSATQPENMVDYDVWFPTGTSSTIEFNALKKNGIQVYPISAKQYVNGALVNLKSKIYQNGEWVSFAVAPTDGLIAEYTFDEFSGNIIPDTSPNGYNLTLQNVTQYEGVVGKAAYFAGNGGAVANSRVIPDGMSGFSGLTVNFWLKLDANTGDATIMCQYNNYQGFYVGVASGDTLEINYGGSASLKLTDNRLTKEQWHNVCLVYNYTTGKLQVWIDGVKLSNSWNCSKFSASNANLTFGMTSTGGSFYLNGSIDQVRLYNRALSDDEIATLWNGGAGC